MDALPTSPECFTVSTVQRADPDPYGNVAMASGAIGATDHSDASVIDEFASWVANFVRAPLKLEKLSMDFSDPSESTENTGMDISQSDHAVSDGRSAWICVGGTQRTSAAVSARGSGGAMLRAAMPLMR